MASQYARIVRQRAFSLLLGPKPPSRLAGVGFAVVGVALITAVIRPLREITPAVSTGVLYLLVVLVASAVWGLWLGLATSVLSTVAFNFFHLPPTGRLTIADERDWVALGVFLVAALVASSIADMARARTREADLRRREADLSAELARLLLGGPTVVGALPAAAQRVAEALGLASTEIDLEETAPREGETALPIVAGEARVGTLRVPADLGADARQRLVDRVVPSLAALLAAALERERLHAEVLETQALRRSDEVKTAVLRSVSHDLRTPLTAITTGAEALSAPAVCDEDREQLAAAIGAEVARLTDLIDKLLDLSRLESGAAQPREDWCSVDELIAGALKAQRAADDRFQVSILGELPLIRGDAAQLERALSNLLDNAGRYGGGRPRLVRAPRGGDWGVDRVVDHGPGLPVRGVGRGF